MQFRLALLGALLLTGGLVAYSAIPAVEKRPILTSQGIMTERLTILDNSSYTVSKNIVATSGGVNTLRLNVSVTEPSGELATLRLQVFLGNDSLSLPCITHSYQKYLVDRSVSNETLEIPADNSGTYCFTFNNYTESDLSDKTALVSVILEKRSEEILVSRNGGANLAGLGVSAFGFLVLAYGVARKTVIPWE